MTYVDNSAISKIGVLIFDVKNAFNSASWEKILSAAEDKGISYPILRVLNDYFSDRSLQSTVNHQRTVTAVTSGVPQGSVLGPTLWNIMYDGLLREHLPTGVDFLAYADDVVLVARGKDVCALERLLTAGAGVVVKWMADMGLELTIHKSEVMIITNTRRHNDIRISIEGIEINTVSSLKYLGIYLKPKLNFTAHAMHVTAKLEKWHLTWRGSSPTSIRLSHGSVDCYQGLSTQFFYTARQYTKDRPQSGLCLPLSLGGRFPRHRRYPAI